MSNILRNKGGFSLVEVIIALTVFAIGIMGTAGLITTVIRNNTFANRMTTAVNLAGYKMEDIKRLGYTNAGNAAGTEDYGDITGYSLYKRITSVTSDSPAANMKTANITVYWESDAHSAALSTIIAK